MKHTIVTKQLFIYLLFIVCTLPNQAQTEQLNTANDTLIVGIAGSEPFVFQEEGNGIASEIWDEIADIRSWNYKYVPYYNVDEALHSLNKG